MSGQSLKQLYLRFAPWVLPLLALALFLQPCNNKPQVLTLDTSVSDIVLVDNVSTSETFLIDKLSKENKELQSVVATLRRQGRKVEYVTQTETVFVPSEPIEEFQELPDSYQHRLANGIVVAEFKNEDDSFTFSTHELTVQTSLAIGKKSTAAVTTLVSSYDPTYKVTVPTEVSTTYVNDHKVIDPTFGVGITGSYPLALYGSVQMNWLHPVRNLDALGARVSFSSKDVRGGVDLIGYNIGDPIPVLTDTWLHLGASYGFTGPSVDLTLSSKF